MRAWLRRSRLAVIVLLTVLSGQARAEELDLKDHFFSSWISPGVLVSYSFGERGGWGFGGELTLMYHRPTWSSYWVEPGSTGFGAFVQAERLRHRSGANARWAGGGQLSRNFSSVGVGPELGLSAQRSMDGSWNHGAHLGGYVSGAGFVSIALRGTFHNGGVPGDLALALTAKLPITPWAFMLFR
jgi:hypothetical protein